MIYKWLKKMDWPTNTLGGMPEDDVLTDGTVKEYGGTIAGRGG